MGGLLRRKLLEQGSSKRFIGTNGLFKFLEGLGKFCLEIFGGGGCGTWFGKLERWHLGKGGKGGKSFPKKRLGGRGFQKSLWKTFSKG